MTDTNVDRLRRTLEDLHAQLERSSGVGADLEEPLREVLDDIRIALERAEAEPGAPEEHESLVERLQEMALGFETEHPLLSGTINRLTHALSSMGI